MVQESAREPECYLFATVQTNHSTCKSDSSSGLLPSGVVREAARGYSVISPRYQSIQMLHMKKGAGVELQVIGRGQNYCTEMHDKLEDG